MAWKSLMSYWSVLGLATQSSRWEQAMNAKLIQMAAAAEKAAALQASVAEHQALAEESQGEALAEETEASELQEEGALLSQASERDASTAAAEQLEVEELGGQIALEEEEAAAHAAAAVVDETTFEAEIAEATADAAEAARSEAQAHGEEVGIGVCEFVPMLDVACDVIGGITAVGLEGAAAAEAAKATTELVAAMATKAEEENELVLAGDFEVKVAEDVAAASELQVEEAEEAELAEEERIAGEQKEAEAGVLLEKAGIEEDTAGSEQTVAAQQEEEATALLSDAAVKGVLCCWDAIMASAFGLLSLGFFSFRITSNVVAPALAGPIIPTQVLHSTDLGRDTSYIVCHIAIFALIVGFYNETFNGLQQNSLQARGGLLLCFAFTGACVQTLILHSIPCHLAKTKKLPGILLEGARFLISFSILYILEILIIWVISGSTLFKSDWIAALDQWYWRLFFLLPCGLHLWHLEVPLQKDLVQRANQKPHLAETLMTTETDALLPTRTRVQGEPPQSEPNSMSWISLLWKDIMQMQTPFEVLLLSCMLMLLIHCLSSIAPLWLASKDLLLSTRPDWLMPFVVFVIITVLSASIISAVSK